MGGARIVLGENETILWDIVGKPEGKTLHARPRCRWKNDNNGS
jgi:hypothetical protein